MKRKMRERIEMMEGRIRGYIGILNCIMERNGMRMVGYMSGGCKIYQMMDDEGREIIGEIEIREGVIRCELNRVEYNGNSERKYILCGNVMDMYIGEETDEVEIREKMLRYMVMVEVVIREIGIYGEWDMMERGIRIEMIGMDE